MAWRPNRSAKHRLIFEFAGVYILRKHEIAGLERLNWARSDLRPNRRVCGKTRATASPQRRCRWWWRRAYDTCCRIPIRILLDLRVIASVYRMFGRVIFVLIAPPVPPGFWIVAKTLAGCFGQRGHDLSVECFDHPIDARNSLFRCGSSNSVAVLIPRRHRRFFTRDLERRLTWAGSLHSSGKGIEFS